MRRCSDHKSTAVVFVESDATSTSCTAGALRVELVNHRSPTRQEARGVLLQFRGLHSGLSSDRSTVARLHNAVAPQSQLKIRF